MDIENVDGWFFPDPKENTPHILSDAEIEQLFLLSEREDHWVQSVRDEVGYCDKHPLQTGRDWILDEIRIQNTGGTVMTYPFCLTVITFPSRRHLFRGEPGIYPASIPSLNRRMKGRSEDDRLLMQALADMRISQFMKFIWKINVVPYWEAKLSDVNAMALAQHYGFDTNLLDLTNDVRVALFFATCKYIPETDSYRPLTPEECRQRQYGMLFHTPDWTVDYCNGDNLFTLSNRMGATMDRPLRIEDGSCDGVAFQIGLQPLFRCHYQCGYILPMVKDAPLQDNPKFEKLYIRLTPELSNRVFEMMDRGNGVFPNEGISEARPILEQIKRSILFSEDDLLGAYERIGSMAYQTVEQFRDALERLDGELISFRKEEIDYPICPELLEKINAKYDNKNLLEPVGGMFHCLPEDKQYRDQRCIEIYGRLIE